MSTDKEVEEPEEKRVHGFEDIANGEVTDSMLLRLPADAIANKQKEMPYYFYMNWKRERVGEVLRTMVDKEWALAEENDFGIRLGYRLRAKRDVEKKCSAMGIKF